MKKKWSFGKVRETQQWLEKRWPEFFMPGPDLQPLTIKIHKDLLNYREEYPAMSRRALGEVLKRHTSSYGYLYGLLNKTHRSDLQGNQVELVSAEHRQWARSTLRSMHKIAQKDRKEKGSGRRCNLTPPPGLPPTTPDLRDDVKLIVCQKAKPVIRYKRAKRRVLPEKLSVELAS